MRKHFKGILVFLFATFVFMPLAIVKAVEVTSLQAVIEIPTEGDNIITTCTPKEDTYTTRVNKWYKGGEDLDHPGEVVDNSEKYGKGSYFVEIAFKATEGNTITNDAGFHIVGCPDGKLVEVNSAGESIVVFEVEPKRVIKFNTDGGTQVPDAIVEDGCHRFDIPEVTKEGYTFYGWFEDAEFEEPYSPGVCFDGSTTLYAKFVPNDKVIKNVNINLEAPTVGTKINVSVETDPNWGAVIFNQSPKPVATVVDNNNVKVDSAMWINGTADSGEDWDQPFAERIEKDQYYYAELDIEAINGNYLSQTELDVKINGEKPAEVFAVYNGTYTRVIAKIKSNFVESTSLDVPVITVTKGFNNSLYVNWQFNSLATRYEVYMSTDKKKWSKSNSTDATSFEVLKLKYGTTYYFKVKACSDTGCTSFSNMVGKKVVPNTVQNLRIKNRGSNYITVTWDKESVDGYEVYVDGKKATTITKGATVTFKKTKLKANKAYKFKVRTYKKVGKTKVYGTFTKEVTFKTTVPTPTLKLGIRDYKEININIGKSAGAQYYRVEKSTDGKMYHVLEELPGTGVLADAAVEIGNKYYYRLSACVGEVCSPASKATIIASVKNPTFTLKTTRKKVTATVNNVKGATGYQVWMSTNKTKNFKLVKDVEKSFVVTGTTVEELEAALRAAEEPTVVSAKTTTGKTYYFKSRSYSLVDGKKVYSPFSGVKSIRSK